MNLERFKSIYWS